MPVGIKIKQDEQTMANLSSAHCRWQANQFNKTN